jgi:hypothetical protein
MQSNSPLVSQPASGADLCGACLVAIALLACPTLALRAGEIYKSVDAEGHVVYSDHLDVSAAAQPSLEVQSTESVADVEVHAAEAPPTLPDSEQPPCSDEGYLWTPGYWSWNAAGYYWIPGAWVQPPRTGVLWTPAYWEFADTRYVFHRGYWAEHIGYYGGINYGFGYFGVGFTGGRWVNSSFAYNRMVSHVDGRVIHNTYSEPVQINAAMNRVSYNGGPGGTTSIMTAAEKAFAAEKHFSATRVQREYSTQAARTPILVAHMPVSIYRPERSAEHHDIEAAQRPALPNAPAVTRARTTVEPPLDRQRELTHVPAARALPQATGARPSKPASTRPALSRSPRAMSLPKS